MNGFGFYIPNADFTGSPLGNIDFEVSDEKLATLVTSTFCTSIGDDTYFSKIYSMVFSLIEQKLWDKMIAIYPIIGNNTNNLVKNLVSNGTDAFVANNASAGTNKLIFSNSIGTGNVINNVTIISDDGHGVSIYANFKNTANELNEIAAFCRNSSTPKIIRGNTGLIGMQANTTVYSTVSASSATSACLRVGIVNDNTYDVTLKVENETKIISSQNYNVSYPMLVGNNIGVNIRNADAMNTEAGATLSSPVKGLFSGEMYFYAIGRLTSTEEDLVKSIFDAFVNSMNKVG